MNRKNQTLPMARKGDLVVTNLQDEVVLYDPQRKKAFCLNHTAALVWKYSDGETTVGKIAELLQKELKTPVEESVVWYALRELEKDGLLAESALLPVQVAGLTRRDLIKTLGKGAAVAVPLIILMAVPSAAQAKSFTGCVIHSTPILTVEGLTISARDVVVGQMLLGANTREGRAVPARVRAIGNYHAETLYSLIAESGETLQCSPSHPVLSPDGSDQGKFAESFKVGDSLFVFDQETRRVAASRLASVEQIRIAQPVIWFAMDSAEHNFISGGIVSHNRDKNFPEPEFLPPDFPDQE